MNMDWLSSSIMQLKTQEANLVNASEIQVFLTIIFEVMDECFDWVIW